jgi:hypothetical protein
MLGFMLAMACAMLFYMTIGWAIGVYMTEMIIWVLPTIFLVLSFWNLKEFITEPRRSLLDKPVRLMLTVVCYWMSFSCSRGLQEYVETGVIKMDEHMATFSGSLKWSVTAIGGGLVIGAILCKVDDWHENRKWRLEREKEKAAWKARNARIAEERYLRQVQAFKAQLGKNSGSTGDVGLS